MSLKTSSAIASFAFKDRFPIRMVRKITSFPARDEGFFYSTPIITVKMSSSQQVHFKLDNLQPSGSFKDRGISHMIHTVASHRKISRLISSSGGNAGNAVAYAGHRLGLPVSVFVPSTTKQMMIDRLKAKGATVTVAGTNWNEADAVARRTVQEEGPSALYCPPFDDQLIWKGNSSLVHEIANAKSIIGQVDAIILSVGGGGLLCGVIQGIDELKMRETTTVLAVETAGAASFAAAKRAGKPVKIDKIDTIATTLGALEVTPMTLSRKAKVDSIVVSDRDALDACIQFANEHRFLVEPACGASLALLYSKELYQNFLGKYKNPLIVVCGGSAVNLELLDSWKTQLQ